MADRWIVCRGGTVVDGKGGAPIERGVVAIRGKRIEAVGPAGSIEFPSEAEVVDATGKTVMPGLIDAHIHLLGVKTIDPLRWVLDAPELRAARAAIDVWRIIDAGFTTVRDTGGFNALSLKAAVAEGSLVGPRILSCGYILTQTGGHGDVAHSLPHHWVQHRNLGRSCDGPDECRKAAREQLRAGADFIKLCSSGGVMSEKDLPTSRQFTLDEIRAMVDEAHAVGAKAASHAQATLGIKNALLAGVDTIEHGIFLDDETIELMLEQGTYLIPTLAIVEAIVSRGAGHGVPAVSLDKARSVQDAHLRSFERACKAGIKIGSGADYLSDPMSPVQGIAAELVLNVKAGRSPMDVIASATRINAEALGIHDRVGTLEAGKLADVLVVNGDPLQDIGVLADRRNIAAVYKEGIRTPRLPEDLTGES